MQDGITASNTLRTELGELARSSRTHTRNTERELQSLVTASELGKEELIARKREKASKEADVARLEEDHGKFKDQMIKEEILFDSHLGSIRDQLHQLKSQDRVNTEMKEIELHIVQDRLDKIQQKRNAEKEAGQEFLRKVADKTVSYMEECTGYRDDAARAVMEAARAKVEIVRKAGHEIQIKVADALKETDRST